MEDSIHRPKEPCRGCREQPHLLLDSSSWPNGEPRFFIYHRKRTIYLRSK